MGNVLQSSCQCDGQKEKIIDLTISPYDAAPYDAAANGGTGGSGAGGMPSTTLANQIINLSPACCCCSADAEAAQAVRQMEQPGQWPVAGEKYSARGAGAAPTGASLDYVAPIIASPYSANKMTSSPQAHNVPPLDLQVLAAPQETPFSEETASFAAPETDSAGQKLIGGRTAVEWASDQAQFADLSPLPVNWIRVRSRTSGAIYYCYTLTGETTFTEPTGPPPGQSGAEASGGADGSTGGQQSSNLPPGWVEIVSRSSGQLYYWNYELQKSQFDKPTATPSDTPPTGAQSRETEDLPKGWKAMVSRSTGKSYYFHNETNTSQFHRPTA